MATFELKQKTCEWFFFGLLSSAMESRCSSEEPVVLTSICFIEGFTPRALRVERTVVSSSPVILPIWMSEKPSCFSLRMPSTSTSASLPVDLRSLAP